jgi:hypothetical protein
MEFVTVFFVVWVRSLKVKLSRIYCSCLVLRIDVQDKVGLFSAKWGLVVWLVVATAEWISFGINKFIAYVFQVKNTVRIFQHPVSAIAWRSNEHPVWDWGTTVRNEPRTSVSKPATVKQPDRTGGTFEKLRKNLFLVVFLYIFLVRL